MVQLVAAIMKSWNIRQRKTIDIAVNINCTKYKQFNVGRQEWDNFENKTKKDRFKELLTYV